MEKLLWKSIALPGHAFHLARCKYSAGKRFAAHSHDFAEIMLIESGGGQQTVNGVRFILKAGDIFMIRPSDGHVVEAGRSGIKLTNLAFPLIHATELEERYLPKQFRRFSSADKLPWSAHLDTNSFTQAVNIFSALAGSMRDRFELERAVMNLFAILRKPFGDLSFGNAPDWLRCACAEMQRPAHLAEGVPAFVRFSGRSSEHTARELRKYSGCTPTEFVNRLRIDHAAQLLCTTEKSVLEVALECGFEHQGHFHSCFKARFKTTPLKYRQKNRAPIL